MPSEFFRTSTTWVVDLRYEGHPRRWFKVFGSGADVRALVSAELRQLYGDRVQVVDVRPATDEEEAELIAKAVACQAGRPQHPGHRSYKASHSQVRRRLLHAKHRELGG